jgi:integrase
MASIQRRGKRWIAEIRSKKLGVYASRSFDTKLQAQVWAYATEQDMGKHGGVVSGKTLDDALVRYAREIAPSHKGCRWERVRIEKFRRDEIAKVPLMHLTTERLQQWVDEQRLVLSGASVNREFNLLSSVLTAARKRWKWMAARPTMDVAKPKNPAPRVRRISPDEVKSVLLALGYEEDALCYTSRQHIAVAFLLAIETAMRHGELWGLDIRDVNLVERYARLHDTKNGTMRDVPLSLRAVELFGKLMGERTEGKLFPMPQGSAQAIFSRAVKLAGIVDLHFHDTRHEGLTRLAAKLTMLELARVVGHQDPRSLMIYYNPTVSELASKLD